MALEQPHAARARRQTMMSITTLASGTLRLRRLTGPVLAETCAMITALHFL